MTISDIRGSAVEIQRNLEMNTAIVGVKLLQSDILLPDNAEKLMGYRYCQALMKARKGSHVILDPAGIACPSASAAFGFREIPNAVKAGKGLAASGIIKDESIATAIYEGMKTFPQGELSGLYLFPLESANTIPDIVIIEEEVEILMWFSMAYLNKLQGERMVFSTAVMQASCVDCTVIPYFEKKMNMSLGCYGCRNATDIGRNEAILGLPFDIFTEVADYLKFLSTDAIPNSRKKNALSLLRNRESQK